MNTNYAIENVVDLTLANFGSEISSGDVARAVNTALLVLEVKAVKKDKQGREVLDAGGKPVLVDYQVTPQMMNNYGRNGMLDKTKRDSMAGVVFLATDIRTWMITFLTNKANGIVRRGGGVKAAELADSIKGKLAQPKQVIVSDDATKGAQAAKAAPAAKADSKK